MVPFDLPPPSAGTAPFRDVVTFKVWLAEQPQTEPLRFQQSLLHALSALDGSDDLATADRITLLEMVRPYLIEVQEQVRKRFARKPVPPSEEEGACFVASQRLWHRLAACYLRVVEVFAAQDLARAAFVLVRGMSAVRLMLMEHYLMSRRPPDGLWRLVHQIYGTAQRLEIARQRVGDEWLDGGVNSSVSGQYAHSIMTHLLAPSCVGLDKWNTIQKLLVRWRELVEFSSARPDDPSARALPLSLFGGKSALMRVAEQPQWVHTVSVYRKFRGRIAELAQGTPPSALDIETVLSGAQCMILFEECMASLLSPEKYEDVLAGEEDVLLTVGLENIYLALGGKFLQKPDASTEKNATGLKAEHHKFAVFGAKVEEKERVKVPAVPVEQWKRALNGPLLPEGGLKLVRPVLNAGRRLLSPCLVGWMGSEGAASQPAMLEHVHQQEDGGVVACLTLLPATAVPVVVRFGQGEETAGIYWPPHHDTPGMVAIPAGRLLRSGDSLSLQPPGATMQKLIIGGLVQRGPDFLLFTEST